METLEGSTLELMHRRRVRSSPAAYAMIVITAVLLASLPLVRVDVVAVSAGMIRTLEEPVPVLSPVTGTVEMTVFEDFRRVVTGDTLLRFLHREQEAGLQEYEQRIGRNESIIREIRSILEGMPVLETSRYAQSYRNHRAQLNQLEIEKGFLYREYAAARELYLQEVIPEIEYERARSRYLVAEARVDGTREDYGIRLEEECDALQREILDCRGKVDGIRASMASFFLTAPSTGILSQCRGMHSGSVLHAGESLGVITPECPLVAECYLGSRDIGLVFPGMEVKIRFDRRNPDHGAHLTARVSQIDPDSRMVNGHPVYRVRCLFGDTPGIKDASPAGALVPGMTFSASMVLYRASLARLILEKVSRWANPVLSGDSRAKGKPDGN
jgi:multidrug resistance efflux pump